MIRPFTDADIDPALALWNHIIAETTITFTTAPKTHADLAVLTTSPTALTATEGDAFQGFAFTQPFRSGPGYAHVAELTIYMEPGARGTGTAARLLAALETRAVEAGLAILVAAISGENIPARRFFTAQDYAQTALMPGLGRKFGRDLDLVLQQKALPERDQPR